MQRDGEATRKGGAGSLVHLDVLADAEVQMALPIYSQTDNSDTEVLERFRRKTNCSKQTVPQQNAAQNQVFH